MKRRVSGDSDDEELTQRQRILTRASSDESTMTTSSGGSDKIPPIEMPPSVPMTQTVEDSPDLCQGIPLIAFSHRLLPDDLRRIAFPDTNAEDGVPAEVLNIAAAQIRPELYLSILH